jgi:hypothetical protein
MSALPTVLWRYNNLLMPLFVLLKSRNINKYTYEDRSGRRRRRSFLPSS